VLLPDVNVLVYAFRRDAENHLAYRDWMDGLVNGSASFGLAEPVLAGFLRVVTHPAIFKTPSAMRSALGFVEALRGCAHAVPLLPGPRHFEVFLDLCRLPGTKGNVVPDAYLAALAIESGSEWVTCDRGFARFPGLRWRHPLDV
jgi:toxin-antitoxin system PIN domain toxin